MADFHDNDLQGRSILRHKVTPHHVQPSSTCHHLEDDDVWAVIFVGLHREAQQLFLKECHPPAVAAQSVQRNDAKSCRLPCVNPISDLGLLQDSQFNVCLGHPRQRQLKASITSVSDVVGLKMDDLRFFVCLPSPPPYPHRRDPRILTHILPMVIPFSTWSTQLWISPSAPTDRPCTSLLSRLLHQPAPICMSSALPLLSHYLPSASQAVHLGFG